MHISRLVDTVLLLLVIIACVTIYFQTKALQVAIILSSSFLEIRRIISSAEIQRLHRFQMRVRGVKLLIDLLALILRIMALLVLSAVLIVNNVLLLELLAFATLILERPTVTVLVMTWLITLGLRAMSTSDVE